MPKRKLNNITQRKDGRWVARKVFGYKPNGKPNRKNFYGSTSAEAAQKLADYERQIENGLNVDAVNLTFEQWLDLWMKEYKFQVLGARTYDVYEYSIKSVIIPVLGKYKLLSLRPEHLQSFINGVKKKNGDPLSVGTIRKFKSIISDALGQAVKNGLIIRNPIDALSMPKDNKKKKVGAYTPKEQTILLNQFENHRFYHLVVTALGTGMRIGELLALKWSDLDFIQNEIMVSASLSRAKDRDADTGAVIGSSYRINPTKTKAGNRVVPLTLEVKHSLLRLKEEQISERLKARLAWVNNDLVFCTSLGDFLDYNYTVRHYSEQRDLTNIPKLSFHCLRHTFATNAISAGVDYYYLSRIMGHTDISITLNVYAEFMPDKSRSEMEKMEGVLLLKFA